MREKSLSGCEQRLMPHGKNDREGASKGLRESTARGNGIPQIVSFAYIIEDCLAARPDPTLFNESLKSLQVSLDSQRHYSQCISDRLDGTLRVILDLQSDR